MRKVTVLVYESIPDLTEAWVIPGHHPWMYPAAGQYANSMETTPEQEEALLRIGDAICDRLDYCDNPDDPLATAWNKYKVPLSEVTNVTGDVQLIVCGFLL